MTATTHGAAHAVIGDATVGALEASLRSDVMRPGDADDGEARAIWNGSHDKRPAIVVRSSPYLCNVIARTLDLEGFDTRVGWARDARDAPARHGTDGVYVNFTGDAGADTYAWPIPDHLRATPRRQASPRLNKMFQLNQRHSSEPVG